MVVCVVVTVMVGVEIFEAADRGFQVCGGPRFPAVAESEEFWYQPTDRFI